MLRSAALAAVAATIAIVGGAGSAWLAVDARDTVGVVSVGGWTALPDRGSPGSDPYARAQLARDGVLPLGQAEGLTFSADQDADGRPLLRDCRYRLAGGMPPARLWTLHADDPQFGPIAGPGGRVMALNSYVALYGDGGTIRVEVSPRPEPGNWLGVAGTGRMVLVLTLYDTPLAGGTEFSDVALPSIVRVDCG
ncbi:MAG: DUF1214 domain-containing protein [Rhizobiaceae bacterium]|nr:DUF1214 domain-containing protein [Rhizobiaceae bacterium]